MTAYLLIAFGILMIAFTIWDIRREETDALFWMDCWWWHVNKTENPWIYHIAIVAQFSVAVIIIAIGVVWLIYFR